MERFGNEGLIRECTQHRRRILIIATIPMHELIARLPYDEIYLNISNFVGRPQHEIPYLHSFSATTVDVVQEGVFNAIWDLVDGEGSREDRR